MILTAAEPKLGTKTTDTKTKILDAAEKLFGSAGFDSTSLRDITTAAQVNLAAVNYHFQSKDSLIDAVIGRRLLPVNQRRLEMLEAAGPSPTVEQIVEAFLTPVLESDILRAGPVIGRVFTSPDQFLERVYKRHLVRVARRFIAAMGQANPNLSLEDRFWRLHFMAGAMSHTLAFSEVLPRMTEGHCHPRDRKALIANLVAFLAAGFRAPSVKRKPTPIREKK